jgi:hypothetical protein
MGTFGLTIFSGIVPTRAAALLAAEKAIWKLKNAQSRSAAQVHKALD